MACILKEATTSLMRKFILSENLSNDIFIGKGFYLGDKKRQKLIDIKYKGSNRRGHLFGFGSTRVGKTRLMENMIEQDIFHGNSVVIIDPKVDNELFSKVYQSAEKAKRREDFSLLSAVLPQYSIKINPLSNYYIIEEVINHVLAAVPAEEEFFYNVALEITTAIVYGEMILKSQRGDKEPLTYLKIAEYVSYVGLNELKSKLETIKTAESNKVLKLVERILQSPQDYFAKVSSTLRTTITQMIMGNMGQIIGNVKENRVLNRLEKDEGVILYVQTGALLVRKSSDILAKTVLSMLQSLIGRRYISGIPFKNSLCIYIDEASNALYYGVENMFNKVGGSNTMITAFTQSIADIVATLGEDRARMILDNTNSKIFMRVNDIDTAKKMIEYGGFMKSMLNMINSGGIVGREQEGFVLAPEQLIRLNPREFYYFGFEGQFFGKTKQVDQSEIVVVSPKIFGEKIRA